MAVYRIKDPLKESIYRWRMNDQGQRERVKTCPGCSSREGMEVYYPLEEFGYRQMKPERPDTQRIQSYCGRCRTTASKVARATELVEDDHGQR